jgi:hypothetical protein
MRSNASKRTCKRTADLGQHPMHHDQQSGRYRQGNPVELHRASRAPKPVTARPKTRSATVTKQIQIGSNPSSVESHAGVVVHRYRWYQSSRVTWPEALTSGRSAVGGMTNPDDGRWPAEESSRVLSGHTVRIWTIPSTK